jgi:hypothetical protein
MFHASIIVSLHAIFVVGLGFRWAMSRSRSLEEVALVIAYITGAEVLWRMTNDALFWETAKYSVTVIAIVAILAKSGLQVLVLPILGFALLLPSIAQPLMLDKWVDAKNELSFNLSGPLALAVCGGFFSTTRLQPRQLQRLLTAWVAPIIGIATIVVYGIVTNPDIQLTHGSNIDLSGGFGPNQVSAALGMGAMLAMLYVVDKSARLSMRVAMFVCAVWLVFQSALTFSRGGLYSAVGATTVGMLVLARDPRTLVKMLLATSAVGLLGFYLIWPRLDAFTSGNLSERFQDTRMTGRADMTQVDLDIFYQHPVLGIGVGQSAAVHKKNYLSISAHTEFTRILAEHGLFGCAALVALIVVGYINIMRGSSPRERAIAVATMTWSILFMMNSAMRLVAPCVAFGFACATLQPAEAAAQRPEPARPLRRFPWRLAWDT